MIGKDQIAEALRYADALAEEHQNLPGYWHERGVDMDGLLYVAEQAGLRALMVMRGENPNLTKPTPVRVSPTEQQVINLFASMFMTGFATRDRIIEPEVSDE